MTPTHLLLVLCALCAILLLTTRVRDCLALSRARRRESSVPPRAPAISVVVPACRQAHELETCLPAILSQEYPTFEVIVVHDRTEDETADVLERMEAAHPRLRHTFVPSVTRFVGRRKLAITLGIKAAKHDWVVLTAPDCVPAGNGWLMDMARHMTDDRDIVLGYANYAASRTRGWRTAAFIRLRRALFATSAALGGRAVDGDACNMAVRKSLFLGQGGYESMLNFTCGEDGLLVDRLADKGNTAVACDAASSVWQTFGSRRDSKKQRLARAVADHYLSPRGKRLKLRQGMESVATYAYAASWCAALALRLTALTGGATYAPDDLLTDVPLVVLLAYPFIEMSALEKSTRAAGGPRFGLRVFFYDLWLPIATLGLRIGSRIHRDDFRRR